MLIIINTLADIFGNKTHKYGKKYHQPFEHVFFPGLLFVVQIGVVVYFHVFSWPWGVFIFEFFWFGWYRRVGGWRFFFFGPRTFRPGYRLFAPGSRFLTSCFPVFRTIITHPLKYMFFADPAISGG